MTTFIESLGFIQKKLSNQQKYKVDKDQSHLLCIYEHILYIGTGSKIVSVDAKSCEKIDAVELSDAVSNVGVSGCGTVVCVSGGRVVEFAIEKGRFGEKREMAIEGSVKKICFLKDWMGVLCEGRVVIVREGEERVIEGLSCLDVLGDCFIGIKDGRLKKFDLKRDFEEVDGECNVGASVKEIKVMNEEMILIVDEEDEEIKYRVINLRNKETVEFEDECGFGRVEEANKLQFYLNVIKKWGEYRDLVLICRREGIECTLIGNGEKRIEKYGIENEEEKIMFPIDKESDEDTYPVGMVIEESKDSIEKNEKKYENLPRIWVMISNGEILCFNCVNYEKNEFEVEQVEVIKGNVLANEEKVKEEKVGEERVEIREERVEKEKERVETVQREEERVEREEENVEKGEERVEKEEERVETVQREEENVEAITETEEERVETVIEKVEENVKDKDNSSFKLETRNDFNFSFGGSNNSETKSFNFSNSFGAVKFDANPSIKPTSIFDKKSSTTTLNASVNESKPPLSIFGADPFSTNNVPNTSNVSSSITSNASSSSTTNTASKSSAFNTTSTTNTFNTNIAGNFNAANSTTITSSSLKPTVASSSLKPTITSSSLKTTVASIKSSSTSTASPLSFVEPKSFDDLVENELRLFRNEMNKISEMREQFKPMDVTVEEIEMDVKELNGIVNKNRFECQNCLNRLIEIEEKKENISEISNNNISENSLIYLTEIEKPINKKIREIQRSLSDIKEFIINFNNKQKRNQNLSFIYSSIERLSLKAEFTLKDLNEIEKSKKKKNRKEKRIEFNENHLFNNFKDKLNLYSPKKTTFKAERVKGVEGVERESVEREGIKGVEVQKVQVKVKENVFGAVEVKQSETVNVKPFEFKINENLNVKPFEFKKDENVNVKPFEFKPKETNSPFSFNQTAKVENNLFQFNKVEKEDKSSNQNLKFDFKIVEESKSLNESIVSPIPFKANFNIENKYNKETIKEEVIESPKQDIESFKQDIESPKQDIEFSKQEQQLESPVKEVKDSPVIEVSKSPAKHVVDFAKESPLKESIKPTINETTVSPVNKVSPIKESNESSIEIPVKSPIERVSVDSPIEMTTSPINEDNIQPMSAIEENISTSLSFGNQKYESKQSTPFVAPQQSTFFQPNISFNNSSQPSTTFSQASSSGNAFGQPSSSSSGTAFGQTSSLNSNAPAFGQTSSLNSNAPAFGQTSSLSSNAPAFGQTSSLSSNAPAFGQTSSLNSNAPAFGQSSSLNANSSAFGQTTFGQTSSLSSNAPAFGQTSSLTSNTSAFGQTSFGSTNFGQTSTFGSNPSSFGSLASNNTPAFGQSSAFGQNAFGSVTLGQTSNNGFGTFGNQVNQQQNSQQKPGYIIHTKKSLNKFIQ